MLSRLPTAESNAVEWVEKKKTKQKRKKKKESLHFQVDNEEWILRSTFLFIF